MYVPKTKIQEIGTSSEKTKDKKGEGVKEWKWERVKDKKTKMPKM